MSFFEYLNYPFVKYAFLVGIMVALCSSFLGVILVIKRYSFIGDGLSHVAFGAMSIATVLNMYGNIVFVLGFTIIAALLILKNNKSFIKSDAKIAVVSVSALALGYLIMNMSPYGGNIAGDVCTTLFGSSSILTLSERDVFATGIISVILIVFYILFYNKIFAITFDEDFQRAIGTKVDLYNTLLSVVIATVIVMGMNLVGSLLISAIAIFPALSALELAGDFKKVLFLSMAFSVLGVLSGMSLSIVFSSPLGATVVMTDLIILIFSIVLRRVLKIN